MRRLISYALIGLVLIPFLALALVAMAWERLTGHAPGPVMKAVWWLIDLPEPRALRG